MSKRIIIYLGHPAHYHLFSKVINNLNELNYQMKILIQKKDILSDLLDASNIEYQNILPEGRKDNIPGIVKGVLKRDLRLHKICKLYKPDLLIGTSLEISHMTRLLKIPSININEDDAAVVPYYVKFSYPWASDIVTPISCNSGKWNSKSIKYNGLHELAYLHPNHFAPDINVIRKYYQTSDPFFIIRFSELKAHHDAGIQGLNNRVARNIVSILKNYGRILITSEKELEHDLEHYRLKINPLDIHHFLAFAKLYIGDSQTMTAEAAVLGTPTIRFNDFVGRIGYLVELENYYNLGFGFRTDEEDKLYHKIEELVKIKNLEEIYVARRQRLLSEKIDVAKFLTWFIHNYPESSNTMKNNPDFQYQFK